jgi:tubulin-like protein CetZ
MKVGFVGIGQAGTSVVDLFAKSGYGCLAINYSESDLKSCHYIERKHLLLGSEGVGKDRSLATSLMQNNWEKTVEVAKEQFSQTSINLIFVIFSTGGGTGSGVASVLLDLLSNELEDKTIVAVPILPHQSESTISHLNTLECIKELSEVDVCLLPIDNNHSTSNNKLSLYKEVNESFFTTINEIISQTSLNSPYSNLDQTDLLKLFSTVGWSTITSINLTKLNSQVNLANLSESILNQQSIFMKPTTNKIIRLGSVFYGQESLMKIIDLQQITSQFNNQPMDIFEGWYPNDTQGRLRLIFTGLSFDMNRLKEIEGKTITDSESLKNVLNESHRVNVKSQINLNKPTKQKKALSSILAKYKK